MPSWDKLPSWDEAWLAVADLETGEHRIVLEGGAAARYASSGHLVFWRAGGLMAVPFDPARPEPVSSRPVRVVEGVRLELTRELDFVADQDQLTA